LYFSQRFGKYRTTLKPGLHFVVPYIDRPRAVHWRYVHVPSGHSTSRPVVKTVLTERIDMREHCVDFGQQHVITRDNVQLVIDALVYYRVVDPRLAVYAVQNLPDAVELLTQSTLRDIVAHLTLDDTFASREAVNDELKQKTFTDAERWGATILRVEIFNISPPGDVRSAMESQIQEERQRRATVLEADGEREAMIIRSKGDAAKMVLEAEADRKALVQRAKGKSEARLLAARAEARALALVTDAVTDSGVRASDYLMGAQVL
jgi:regulator of protease activity HflC (stomatin/prohibitin superfamily)